MSTELFEVVVDQLHALDHRKLLAEALEGRAVEFGQLRIMNVRDSTDSRHSLSSSHQVARR